MGGVASIRQCATATECAGWEIGQHHLPTQLPYPPLGLLTPSVLFAGTGYFHPSVLLRTSVPVSWPPNPRPRSVALVSKRCDAPGDTGRDTIPCPLPTMLEPLRSTQQFLVDGRVALPRLSPLVAQPQCHWTAPVKPGSTRPGSHRRTGPWSSEAALAGRTGRARTSRGRRGWGSVCAVGSAGREGAPPLRPTATYTRTHTHFFITCPHADSFSRQLQTPLHIFPLFETRHPRGTQSAQSIPREQERSRLQFGSRAAHANTAYILPSAHLAASELRPGSRTKTALVPTFRLTTLPSQQQPTFNSKQHCPARRRISTPLPTAY